MAYQNPCARVLSATSTLRRQSRLLELLPASMKPFGCPERLHNALCRPNRPQTMPFPKRTPPPHWNAQPPFTPSALKIIAAGHHPVTADCIMFTPMKAVNHMK